MMFCLLLLLPLVSSAEVLARRCTTVNGVSGACHLRLNQFTLAGSHNSGAGAFGAMYYWAGTLASGCWYPTQDKTITEQLALGVRYFDFDTAYIGAGHASGAYWEEGIVIVHGKAYSRSLRKALKEIEEFMGAHPDSVVVIRIRSEYAEWATGSVRQHLPSELSFLVTSDHIRLNEERNPLLSSAISTNKRLIIFVQPTLLSSPRYLHRLHQVENGNYGYAISNCFDAVNIENGILADARANVGYFALQINWFNTQGLCNAGVCDGTELTKLEVINKAIVLKTGRPINLVLIDYVGSGGVRLSDVVSRINEFNVKHNLSI